MHNKRTPLRRTSPWRRGFVAAMISTSSLLATAAFTAVSGAPAAAASPAVKIPAARCAENRAAGTINDVVGNFFGPGAGGIEDFVAQQLGFFKTECLTVNLLTTSVNATELVSTDAAQIGGAGSAADFLESAANGANIEGVVTFGDASPYTLLTQTSITNLKQLEGKTVGYHTSIPVILLEELKKAGVDTSKVDFVNDTSYNPDLLPEGDFYAIQAYTDNEPLTLKSQGLPFTEWDPDKYGVPGTYDPEFVNRTWAKKHPTAIADFLRADIYALDYCYGHGAECVNIEAQAAAAAGASYPIPHKLQQFNSAAHLVIAARLPKVGFGVETYAEWQPEYNALKQFHVVKSLPPLKQVENTTIVASLYSGTKLIWPGP